MKCDIEVHWHITYACNFDCVYCFTQRLRKRDFKEIRNVNKIVDSFDNLGLTCQVNISGGEPFIFPNFVEMCKRLTEKHILSINTNLSQKNVYEFAEKVDPKRVRYLNCSVNIQAREKRGLVDDYIEKYNFLKKKGFFVFATYVTYPPFISRFEKDYEYFKSKGVILRPKVFRGKFESITIPDKRFIRRLKPFFTHDYPKNYSKKQKKKLLSYIEISKNDSKVDIGDKYYSDGGRFLDVSLDHMFINEMPSFKGKQCLAGKEFVRMNPVGEVRGCHSGNDQYLGNLFDGTLKLRDKTMTCPYDICVCPYLGYRYALKSKN